MSDREIIRVSDVMYPEFDIVEGTQTVASAIKNAKHLETGCIIVDRRDKNDEYGILLLADVAKYVIAEDRAPERISVYEIMSKPMVSVHSTMNVRYCARLFHKFGLTLAPATEDGNIVGIVTYNALVLKALERIVKE